MDNRLGEFIEGLERARNLEGFKRHLGSVLSDIGFDWFGYVCMDVPNVAVRPEAEPIMIPRVAINIAPSQWVERYAEQNYYGDDPVIRESVRSVKPFRWNDAAKRREVSPIGKRVMAEAGECGLHNGLTMPVHSPGGRIALLSVCANESQKELDNPLADTVQNLLPMSIYFHAAVQHHLDKLEQLPQEIVLRPREIECLRWTARGKTAWEISMILKVSERTVNFHLGNAMRKLGVYNKTHAVAKMMTMGLSQP